MKRYLIQIISRALSKKNCYRILIQSASILHLHDALEEYDENFEIQILASEEV